MSASGERPRAPRPGRAACAFFASVLTLSLFWAEAALAQTQNCPNPLPSQTARVHQVYRVDPGSNLVPRSSVDTQQPPPVPTELGDTIAVVVEDLESLIVEQRCRSNGGAIVLYLDDLDGQAVPGATAYPPSDPANK